MKSDYISLVVQEIRNNYSKFAVITTAASVIVGIIVAFMVLKGVVAKSKED